MTTDDIELEPALDDVDAAPVADRDNDRDNDVRSLPDSALRSALEFAVGIAAAGQKLRPPLVFPSALKPLLKLNRLDRTSLRIARRAIVGDDGFRSRLAMVATDELVDEIGLLWLTRTEGWVDATEAARARAKDSAEAETIEAQLRKSERRREAAEQAAARVNAELLGHRELVDREQLRRVRADERAAVAQHAAASAEGEASRLRHELDTAKARVDAERLRADRAEDSVRTLTAELQQARELRDAVLADRAESRPGTPEVAGPIGGNSAAAQALRTAASATRDLATALAAAGDALSDGGGSGDGGAGSSVGVKPPKWARERPPQRRPIAIPGGVYGDSVAAAEHLVRVPGARVIVDAYNLAKLAWPGRELIEQRECLISLLEDFVRRTGVDMHAVFDGADVVGATGGRRIVRVQFSPAGVTADDVIREVVASLPASTPVVVVTNDQAIVNDMRVAGVNTVSSDVLLVVAGFTAPGNRRR